MQHIEFFHIDHFQNNYFRVKPPPSLSNFIDFFWETDFEKLLEQYPEGFSDALFPNIGYTYLINLGSPFVMQVEDQRFAMKTDGFLPRHKAIECYHQTGNKIFGIKFRISPVIFEKKINFSEYRESIYPLSYLVDQVVINRIKKANNFEERVSIAIEYFSGIVMKYSGSMRPIEIVTAIMEHCNQHNDFSTTIESFAAQYKISTRTLQRHFENATSISSKSVIQIMRVRKATHHLATSPQSFHYSLYGYYDHSHFYKHLKKFLHKSTIQNIRPHLKLLEELHL
ncbi:MAG: helix-turn-helix domain-containing protein [Ginsengibacter sp.]